MKVATLMKVLLLAQTAHPRMTMTRIMFPALLKKTRRMTMTMKMMVEVTMNLGRSGNMERVNQVIVRERHPVERRVGTVETPAPIHQTQR